MDLGVQILHYYLKRISIILFILLIILIVFINNIFIKKNLLREEIIHINQGENFSKVINKNFTYIDKLDYNIFKIYYFLNEYFYDLKIHYGHFNIKKEISFYDFLNIVSKPSNILNKITIIEGWSQNDLNKELSKYFSNFQIINYEDIIADTYYFNKLQNFESFYKTLKIHKDNYINKNLKNKFFNQYSIKDIFIIGSLLEKEGTDYIDKRNISSVIFNRLDKKMRLQIDASVIYSITDGKYNLDRKLLLKDLKFKHQYNTYLIDGLPPGPISYVGTKTIDIILENYKSEYLFYFYDKNFEKHIFSKSFNEHKKKLNDYRNEK